MGKCIKLSILVPTYNHESYIEECINSILIQKVNFEYEVFIGEDCSTDNTAKVLQTIEKKLPTNYKVFYRKENMGGMGNNNLNDLIAHARGEYVIILEGDDYWINEHKLQKQVEFLDANSDYIAVSHDCIVVDENSKLKCEIYPSSESQKYSFKQYLKHRLPGQTASIMCRRSYYKTVQIFKEHYKLYELYPGDQLKAFLLLTLGNIECINEEWSAYRHVTTHGTSYSATIKYDDEAKRNEVLFYKSIFNYADSINSKEAILTAGKLYFYTCFKRSIDRTKIISFLDYVKQLFSQKYCFIYIGYSIKSIIKVILNKIFKLSKL